MSQPTQIDLEKIIPGLAEAREAEQASRFLAFIDIPQRLLGVPVRHLTPRMCLELSGAKNPLIEGGIAPHKAIIEFLWRLSPRFCRPGTLRWWLTKTFRMRLRRHVLAIDPINASVVVRGWLDRQLMDTPPSSSVAASDCAVVNLPTGYTWIATIVDWTCETYAWSVDDVLDMPLCQLWQYFRANRARNGHKLDCTPPSGELVRRWFREMTSSRDSRTGGTN